jgi:hypothetical protein
MEDLKKESTQRFKKIITKWNALTSAQKYGVGIGGAFLIIILVALTINIFTSGVFGEPIEVQVYASSTSTPVENAVVRLDSKESSTNSKGVATFRGIRNRLYEVSISHPDYADFQGSIDIDSGNRDTLLFFIESVAQSTIQGSVTSDNGILLTEGITVRAGEQEGQVDESGTFVLENVSISATELIIESADYVDTSISLILNQGLLELEPITLFPSYDYTVDIRNFVNRNPIEGARVTIQDQTYTSDSEGLVTIRDIPIQETPELTVTKDGFNETDFTVNSPFAEEASLTVIDQVFMSPIGKVLYTSEREGSSNVYAANYDGSEEVKINSQGESAVGSAQQPVFSGTDILFYTITANANAPQVFKTSNPGETPQLVSSSGVRLSDDETVVQEF